MEDFPTPLRSPRRHSRALRALGLLLTAGVAASSFPPPGPEDPPVASPPVESLAGPAGEEGEDDPAAEAFADEVRPLLEGYCFRCHGERKQRGDIRLDVLDPDMINGPDAEGWHTALDMLNGGEMPPRKAKQPTDEERRLLVSWMTRSLEAAAEARAGDAKVVLRRLTKDQYTHSLQDLLGIDVNFGAVLPNDGKSKMGFSNSGEVLQASPLHLDYYQALAREGLKKALAIGPKPPVTRYRVRFGEGLGAGLVAGHTGGYQSVPLDTDDFVVEILGDDGLPQTPGDEEGRAAFEAIQRRISVGLRGSSHERFRIVEEGMLLYGALPHRERVPQSWQGPSPNLKLELQRCFPEAGDFVMRVKASRGYVIPAPEQLLVGLEGAGAAGEVLGLRRTGPGSKQGHRARRGRSVLGAVGGPAPEPDGARRAGGPRGRNGGQLSPSARPSRARRLLSGGPRAPRASAGGSTLR